MTLLFVTVQIYFFFAWKRTLLQPQSNIHQKRLWRFLRSERVRERGRGDVHVDRVADVRGPVGDGSLLRGNGLHNESEPRAHGEAAVLELLDLELLKVLRLGESERVEAASRVDVSHSQLREGVLHDARAVALRESNGEDLDDDDVPEGREAAALRRERSDGTREDEVRALVRRAELASLEPRHARAHLGAPRSRDSEHGPASVDDFAL
eukprot:CAMPEP_0198711806 /NCGR_PEP_ID=MMETSP1471-20131121/3793_1 /TAXON_ID=41880 /ORGANISM="Pycnococcus provasolii, Strain RCC733" /LENGTH=208 /DNA_ID=CAMNT_0044471681 /DNA_START=45 /DNA_END=668 /DNA_ORIENTATION=+